MSRYFIFAGEASGDLHGSHLMHALKAKETEAYFEGVGGPCMRKEGLICFQPTESFQVMGFSDVLKAFPRLWSLFWQVHKKILTMQPDAVILIDYPGFNLRLAKALRKKGYQGQIIQYICPSVWAYGKKRIKILANYFNLLLTILPFEASYFAHTPLPVTYVGHPLVEQIHSHVYQMHWWKQCHLPSFEKIVALFPGSRLGEIQRHTAAQLKAVQQLQAQDPSLIFALSCAHENLREPLIHFIKKSGLRLNQDIFIIPACYTQELMKECYLALAKSGTVTLELAIHQIPTVVHYKVSLLNYGIAKYFLKLNLPYYCLVNILGKKEIFPERIGYQVSAETLSTSLLQLHTTLSQRQTIRLACRHITKQLGQHCSSSQAAEAIIQALSC